jgi:hypothetical protein
MLAISTSSVSNIHSSESTKMVEIKTVIFIVLAKQSLVGNLTIKYKN